MVDNSFQISHQVSPILVFGRDGQVGKALQKQLSDQNESAIFLSHDECDLANEDAIIQVLDQYKPQAIINAAAYTEVDRAETEFELCFAVNARAPQIMATYIASITDGVFLHYSSDYVFADTKVISYEESDQAGPVNLLNVYAGSKLSGEQLIEEAFDAVCKDKNQISSKKDAPRFFILRSSWLYGHGDNFIKTILKLSSSQEKIHVVNDQIGVPTSAEWLAEVSMKILFSNTKSGIYHVVPDGETSWYDLALFVIELAISQGVFIGVKPQGVLPVSALQYSSQVKRPYNSRLNNAKFKRVLTDIFFAGHYPHWSDHVKPYVKENAATFLKGG